MILDQLKKPKITNQSQQWNFITDQVMGGISTGKFGVEEVYGNEKNYNIHLRTGLTVAPWQYYSYTFVTTKNWREIRAPFDQFKKSNFYQPKSVLGQNIKSVGLVAGFDNFKSDICLSEIGFY